MREGMIPVEPSAWRFKAPRWEIDRGRRDPPRWGIHVYRQRWADVRYRLAHDARRARFWTWSIQLDLGHRYFYLWRFRERTP